MGVSRRVGPPSTPRPWIVDSDSLVSLAVIVIAKCVMVIVLSVDTGALIVAAIVTMLPFE